MMENVNDLLEIYNQYLLLYPKEAPRLIEFQSFITRFNDKHLYDRQNFAGHITASAIVIGAMDAEILLLEHRKLNRWLQPGGHIDETDSSILQAALRELYEEANINADQVKLLSPSLTSGVPLDIDSHFIPANPGKLEPEHYHHDLRYLFIYSGPKEILFNEAESVNYKWEPLEMLKNGDALNTCVEKIRHLL